jgi:hypothetical protein
MLTDDPDYSPGDSPRIRTPDVPRIEQLRAEAVSPYTVRLSWEPAGSAAVHHYNVYCSQEADFTPSQASLVASPDLPEQVDWGLRPGARLFYRVSCVDRWGKETRASDAIEVRLPDIQRVVLDAEGADRITFETPVAGTYVLWMKLKDGGRGGSYITVKMDDERGRTWTCGFDGLSDESWFTYDQWGRFGLGAGRHTLALENKTKHTVLGAMLTNDLSLKPEGHVNTVSGW